MDSIFHIGVGSDVVHSLGLGNMAKKDINRIKIVLVENKRTAKRLADQLGKDPATVSKWCTNSSQPSLETLVQVAEVLDVDVRSLIVQTKKMYNAL